jgi:hypothetical protein
MVIARKEFIFQLFSVNLPPFQIHFSQLSNHMLKAMENWSAAIILMTPSQVFFEAVLIHGEASQLLLHPPEQDEVH